jgi:hypothetical protein
MTGGDGGGREGESGSTHSCSASRNLSCSGSVQLSRDLVTVDGAGAQARRHSSRTPVGPRAQGRRRLGTVAGRSRSRSRSLGTVAGRSRAGRRHSSTARGSSQARAGMWPGRRLGCGLCVRKREERRREVREARGERAAWEREPGRQRRLGTRGRARLGQREERRLLPDGP